MIIKPVHMWEDKFDLDHEPSECLRATMNGCWQQFAHVLDEEYDFIEECLQRWHDRAYRRA